MIDKRKLENILTDQVEELSAKSAEHFCRRREEEMIELDITHEGRAVAIRPVYDWLLNAEDGM